MLGHNVKEYYGVNFTVIAIFPVSTLPIYFVLGSKCLTTCEEAVEWRRGKRLC